MFVGFSVQCLSISFQGNICMALIFKSYVVVCILCTCTVSDSVYTMYTGILGYRYLFIGHAHGPILKEFPCTM